MRFVPTRIKNDLAAGLSILLSAVLFFLIWKQMGWPAGGMDSWNHYLFARWAPTHPDLIWDQWGKTLFTIPTIPFAKFGMNGMYVFNVLCCLIGAFFCYKTARKLSILFPWMAVLFYVFQPIVFGNTISALTEPLNAMVLSIILYLLADNRFTWAAVLTSFLPFFRTEGWVLLLGILIYFIASRKYIKISFFAIGSLVFSVLGKLFYGDFKWFISSNPYFKEQSSGRDWGHGGWLHYLEAQKSIWGIAITLLMAIALVLLVVYMGRMLRNKTAEFRSVYSFWLLAPIFLGFFMAHTIIWVFGMFGSNGLTRVFYVVAPCAALLASYAMHKLCFIDIRKYRQALVLFIAGVCIYSGYKGSGIPFPWKNEVSIPANRIEPQLKKALSFINNGSYKDYHQAHQLPVVHVRNDTDPWASFDQAKATYLWSIDPDPKKDYMPEKTIIIWDGVHAAREGGKPKDVMFGMSNYKKIMEYKSDIDSIHDVILFEKIK